MQCAMYLYLCIYRVVHTSGRIEEDLKCPHTGDVLSDTASCITLQFLLGLYQKPEVQSF